MQNRMTRDEAEALKLKVIDRLNMSNLSFTVKDGAWGWDEPGKEGINAQVEVYVHPFDPTDQVHYVEVSYWPSMADSDKEIMTIMTNLINLLQVEFKLVFFITERSHAIFGEV